MLFCVKTPINKLYVFGMALLLAATLAGCGGGGGTAAQCPPGQVGTPPNCTTPPPQPTPATPDEQFAARMARSNAETAKMAAMAAVPGAVTAATDAADKANMYAMNAAGSASTSMAARTDYMNAKMVSDAAAAENAKAMAAKTAADGAQTALSDAVTAYEAAVKDQDIETKAGATAIKTAADALKAAAMKAQMDAMKAQSDAEAARDMAMAGADDAAMYAATHVLGLFKAANHVSVEDADDRKAEVKKVATAIAAAVASSGIATVSSVTWPADTPDNPDTDDNEFTAGVLRVNISGVGDNITSDTMGTDRNADDDTADAGEGPNARKIDGLPGFTHGFDISAHPADSNEPDGRHVIVFTDKQQGTPAVTAVEAVTAKTLTNAVVSGNTVTDLGAMSGNGYTGVTFFEGTDTSDSGAAFTGNLTCPSGTPCSTTVSGDTITVEGYVFTGSRPARKAVAAADAAENNSYLAFGVWLQEDSDTGTDGLQPAFGAFADGGASISGNFTPVEGTATYNGAATGVYTNGAKVDYFQGDATLIANFDEENDNRSGTIFGTIDNIVAGGMAMSDVIDLHPGDIHVSTASFVATTSMGPSTVTGTTVTYDYNGRWAGSFYNPAKDEAGENDLSKAPGSVAGTFGVTGTTGEGDDAVTRSYVGALGAHKQ